MGIRIDWENTCLVHETEGDKWLTFLGEKPLPTLDPLSTPPTVPTKPLNEYVERTWETRRTRIKIYIVNLESYLTTFLED